MKYLVYADPHWSAYSSIVRSRGEKYSTRLENLVNTINWVEETAEKYQCNKIVCLGDFFDKSDLNSEEVTALQDIRWYSKIPHYYLVGNHEMGRSDLSYSSSHMFHLCPNSTVIDKPTTISTANSEVCFLPYILESERQTLDMYFPKTSKSRIIFSHNDISGVQMGKFISTDGFTIEEIENNCNLFLNGHIHNWSLVGSHIINIGNVTGQNFSEDATTYRHYVVILDDEAHSIEWEENPYAFNFYKYDLTDFDSSNDEFCKKLQSTIDSMGPNAVVTIKVSPHSKLFIEDLISTNPQIVSCRVVVDTMKDSSVVKDVTSSIDMSLDHLAKFAEYVKTYLGNESEVIEELTKVIG